jgi:hypothetical protein
LVAIGLHARRRRGFGIGGGRNGFGVGFMEDSLNNLLFFRTKDLGQILIELGLLLLKAWKLC